MSDTVNLLAFGKDVIGSADTSGGGSIGSVSVTTDGVKTWPQLFDGLFAIVDSGKVSEHACLKIAYSTNAYEVYCPVWINKGTEYMFARHYYASGNSTTVTIDMQSSGSSYTINGSPSTSIPSAGYATISIIY